MLEQFSPRTKQGNAALTVIAVGVGIAVLYFGRVFLITVVIAIILSFLLDRSVRLFMRLRLPRALASFVDCSIALVFLYLVGLGLFTEASALLEDLPTYSQRISEFVEQVGSRAAQIEKTPLQ